MRKYIAYYRVSTSKQGNSGLGLEAQKNEVMRYTNGNILHEFTDVASGKKSTRPELENAIAMAKSENAVLIFAKLDRLSRDVEFIFSIRNAGIEIVCCDLPDLNTLTIGIFATMAQYERELISERTKKALAVKKAQGVKLGKPENLTNEAKAKGREANSRNAKESKSNQNALIVARDHAKAGTPLSAIADSLNFLGIKTRRGGKWHKSAVHYLLKKAC
jgi:DNA invertase Pin-like site-specific DNA recombinase